MQNERNYLHVNRSVNYISQYSPTDK